MGCVFSSPEPSGSQGGGAYSISMLRRPMWSIISNIFSTETAWPIKAKFYVKPPWKGGTNFYINGPGHMTKMSTMPIYSKKTLTIFCSRTGSLMILKLGMQHKGLKLYKVYINDEPGLTLTYFTARSNWVAYMFEWGKLLQSFFGGKLAAKD